jgi:hypothetical protein
MLIDEKIATILSGESSNFNNYLDVFQSEIEVKGIVKSRNLIITDMLYYLLNLDLYPNINLEIYKRLNQLTELFSSKPLTTTIPEVTTTPTPTITTSVVTLNFGSVLIGEYGLQSFTFTASNLANIVSIIPPSKYTISLNQYHNFSTSISIVPSSEGTINSTTIYVRYTPTTVSTDLENIVVSSGSATISVTVFGVGREGT